MKTIIDIIGSIIIVIAIIFGVIGAAFAGWCISTSERMTLTDKASYIYATEICGENDLEYWIGSFVNDVQARFD